MRATVATASSETPKSLSDNTSTGSVKAEEDSFEDHSLKLQKRLRASIELSSGNAGTSSQRSKRPSSLLSEQQLSAAPPTINNLRPLQAQGGGPAETQELMDGYAADKAAARTSSHGEAVASDAPHDEAANRPPLTGPIVIGGGSAGPSRASRVLAPDSADDGTVINLFKS
ncbi:unnamed protein product, partial [Amoebophrya sp. A120]